MRDLSRGVGHGARAVGTGRPRKGYKQREGLLWAPKQEQVESSQLTDYLRWLDRGFASYQELWEWSVTDLEGFWGSLWRYFGIEWIKDPWPELSQHYSMS